MLLADFGAEIIKVERPVVGDLCRHWPPFKNGHSAYFSFLNRGKKSITIDARTEEGKSIIKKLVSKADVVCENFKVGNMERLGLGYDELVKINPRLIYGSISGFGITGPCKDIAAYDLMLQAMSGLAHITGNREGPPTKVGPAIGDHFSGVYLAISICIALIHRERTGEGQRAEISILDTLFTVLDAAPVTFSVTGNDPCRNGNTGSADAPSDTFHTSDGIISLSIAADNEWQRLCRLISREDLAEHPDFSTSQKRLKNYEPHLKAVLSEFFKTKKARNIEETLHKAGLACVRVPSIQEAINLDHFREREMLIDVDDALIGKITMPGISIKMSRTPASVSYAGQELGKSTDTILQEAGFSNSDIEKFHRDKIV